jgi:hypothetical protein
MTSKRRDGRLLPFAAPPRSARTPRADDADPPLAALLAEWRVPDPPATLDTRVMTSAQRLLAPLRRRRAWRLIALAAGLILALAIADRSMLSAAGRMVRESVAGVRRAASSLFVVASREERVALPLPGRPAFSAEALVPLVTPARAVVPPRTLLVPRVDMRTRVALEVHALGLLARGQMLAGTQIEVAPTDAGIAILGVTDTPEQRQSVIAALGGFATEPGVTVEIHPATELSRTRPRHTATPQVRVVEIAPDAGEVDAEQRAFMNRALAVSRDVLVHALSLRQLATRFSPAARREMTAATQHEWRSLLRSMAELIRRQAHQLRAHLQPMLSSARDEAEGRGVAAPLSPVAADEDAIAGVAHDIVTEAMAVDEQIRGAFARSTRSATLNATLVARALERLEALATVVSAQ